MTHSSHMTRTCASSLCYDWLMFLWLTIVSHNDVMTFARDSYYESRVSRRWRALRTWHVLCFMIGLRYVAGRGLYKGSRRAVDIGSSRYHLSTFLQYNFTFIFTLLLAKEQSRYEEVPSTPLPNTTLVWDTKKFPLHLSPIQHWCEIRRSSLYTSPQYDIGVWYKDYCIV